MTKYQLLELLLGHARSNGFLFRRWYAIHIRLTWNTASEAIARLCEERRYYALLFSHEFAQSFWKAGAPMTFQVDTQTFPRSSKDGSTRMVSRKGYTRRTSREDAWRYHLQQMAVAEDPLRYIRRFLPIAEELEPEPKELVPVRDPRFLVDDEDLLEDDANQDL